MRWIAFVVVVAAAGFGCRKSSAPTPSPAASSSVALSPDAAFWSWFVAHANEAAKIASGKEPVASDLARELHAIDPNLTFEIGHGQSEQELVISADGIQATFPVVKRLVAAAPKVPGWEVTAFRPRKASDSIALSDGTVVVATNLFFKVLATHDQKVDIDVYVKGAPMTDGIKSAVFLHLDAVLGEYDVETYVAGIEVKAGSAAPPEALPLAELAKTVDALKTK